MAHIIKVTLRYECAGSAERCRQMLERDHAPYQGRTESFSDGLNSGHCVTAVTTIERVDPSYTDE